MVERKIIFKCVIGSKLYGTNGPDSDTDHSGVFLPSTEDVLSLGNCPTEWSMNEKLSSGERNEAGDTDCKYYSIQRFMKLAMEGQPGQLELFFVPDDKVLIVEPEWIDIKRNMHLFLSKQGVAPFVGFATAQSYKAEMKGENLNYIRNIIDWAGNNYGLYRDRLSYYLDTRFSEPEPDNWYLKGTNIKMNVFVNESGADLVEVAGRNFDINVKLKDFLSSLKQLEQRYGTRSNAAAEKGQDCKSLSHALRLISEAKEFLSTGKITLPLPNADLIKLIKEGKHEIVNWGEKLTEEIDFIKQFAQPNSLLPDVPDHARVNVLCRKLLLEHLTDF